MTYCLALRSVSGYEANGVFRELYPSSELIPHPLGMRVHRAGMDVDVQSLNLNERFRVENECIALLQLGVRDTATLHNGLVVTEHEGLACHWDSKGWGRFIHVLGGVADAAYTKASISVGRAGGGPSRCRRRLEKRRGFVVGCLVASQGCLLHLLNLYIYLFLRSPSGIERR